MGRNRFSRSEIEQIRKLLRRKASGNRNQQKLIRHDLRTQFEFNISDFNRQGEAFGEQQLLEALHRGAIQILDEATIEAMKEKRARDRARDAEAMEREAVERGAATDWKEAMRLWEEEQGNEGKT